MPSHSCMLDVEIRLGIYGDSEWGFVVALSWPFGPTPRFEVTVASVGKPCFAPLHPLCPMWESLRGPWHALWETPQRSRHRAEVHWLTTFTHWNKWVFLILAAWWNQIIITGLITDTAVTLACVINQNSNPWLLFVFSSTHQPMNEANRNTNHTSREYYPSEREVQRIVAVVCGTGDI